MASLAALVRAGRQFVGDALPGGSLNPEVTQDSLINAAELASMMPNPVGDIASGGLALRDLLNGNYGSAALNGVGLFPFVPAMGGVINPVRKQAREAYKANKEIFDNAHKADNLSFQALPINETSEAVRIYQSPRYGGKAPSEYMVGMVNGEPAYIRKSDHWGKFTTNIKEGTAEAKAAGLGDKIGDQFGRVGYKPHNWELQGGISSQHADRIATAQAFRDALPEAQRFGEIGNRLWDELYALTKPGKREAGYIPLSKLLGNRTE
jgi:hypothetical protein